MHKLNSITPFKTYYARNTGRHACCPGAFGSLNRKVSAGVGMRVMLAMNLGPLTEFGLSKFEWASRDGG